MVAIQRSRSRLRQAPQSRKATDRQHERPQIAAHERRPSTAARCFATKGEQTHLAWKVHVETERTRSVLVDGNTAVIELSIKARTYQGTPYENDYALFYQFNDEGLLTEMRDYADTMNAARQLTACYAESIRELAKAL